MEKHGECRRQPKAGVLDGTAVVDLCPPGSGGMEGQSRQEDEEVLTGSQAQACLPGDRWD